MQNIVHAPSPGDIISDRYEIVDQLGVGGFGAVYKAVQIGMNREVAIKTLLPHLVAIEGVEERFQREAQLASDLVSPHTIRLYDFGKTAEGMLYIAMELLRGQELEHALKKEGPLAPEEVKQITLQILDSLAEAHSHGIVHRDLKPSNISLTEVGRNKNFVKVLDFGIAKAVTAKGEDQKLTATGQTLGTPYYMAPEQIRGKALGPYTDIYAVGLMMIEMATGHVAVQGATPLETVLFHVNEDPIPMPNWLRNSAMGPVIARAAEKDLSRRYANAEQMIADLERVDTTMVTPGAMNVGRPQGFAPETAQLPVGDGNFAAVADSGQVPQVQSGQMYVPGGPGYSSSGQMGVYPPDIDPAMYGTPPQNSAMKVVIGILVLLVLLGVGVFVFLFLTGNGPGTGEASATSEGAEDPTPPSEGGEGAEGAGGAAGEATGAEAAGENTAGAGDQVEPGGEAVAGDQVEPGGEAAAGGEAVAGSEAVEAAAVEAAAQGQAGQQGAEGVDETAAAETISLTVRANVDGATVLRGTEVLGETPLVIELPIGEGTETLVLRRDRYEEESVDVDMVKGGEYAVSLKRTRKPHVSSTSKDEPKSDASAPTRKAETRRRRSLAVDDDEPAPKRPSGGSLAVD